MLKTADPPWGVNSQSTSWHIEEPVLICDLLQVDSSLAAEYSNFLLKGSTLSIPFVSYYTSPHAVTNGPAGFQIAMTRSLSRLKAFFVTFSSNANSKYCHDMMYPSISASAITEFVAQIGSEKYPSHGELKTLPEYWHRLLEAIGIHASVFTSSAISLTDFTADSFVIGINLQKVLSDDGKSNYSGKSTKMGDLVSLRCKNIATSIDTCWVTLVYDGILTLSEEAAAVFD